MLIHVFRLDNFLIYQVNCHTKIKHQCSKDEFELNSLELLEGMRAYQNLTSSCYRTKLDSQGKLVQSGL